MKTRIAMLVGLCLCDGAVLGGDAGKDQKALQGAWTFKKDKSYWTFTFTGNNFTLYMGEGDDKKGPVKGTIKLDPSKSPKQIDMTVNEAPGDQKKYEGKTSLGIYDLKGNTLKWCASEPGDVQRPSEFAERGGDRKFVLMEFQKQKK